MVIIPAIDIINGACVRLSRGDYDTSRVYDENPLDVAAAFEAAGAARIHIVDLDAARGTGNNRKVIERIRTSSSCMIETGGGIRTDDDVKELLDCGVDRLIAGTVLASNPDLVAGWIARYGRHFIAGIDALDGEVRVAGWKEGSGLSDAHLARLAAEMGAVGIIYTNIAHDGMLQGPDLESTLRIAGESGIPVILSGGISSDKDIADACAAAAGSGIRGIITGKAVYEGRLDLAGSIEKWQSADELEMEW